MSDRNLIPFKIDYLFIKFLLVGALNTLFGYGIFALLLFIGLHYALASILATILGVLFNFKTTGILVFKNHDNRLIFKFVSAYCLTTVLSIIGLKFAKMVGLNLYFAGLILTGIMAIITFILQKKCVFRKEDL